MEPGHFLTASRLHIVAGKGGVGKTAVTAVMAEAASMIGLSALVIDVGGRSALPGLLGHATADLTPESGTFEVRPASSSRGRIEALCLAPDLALVDYLSATGVGRIADRLGRLGVIDVVTHSTPGMSDILVLGKIKKLAREHDADVIVVDAPASGHAITFLQAPSVLAGSVDNGAIRDQADEVLDLLSDPARCQVTLVTLAEETPISETVETAYSIEDEVGIKLGPVVINGKTTPLCAAPAVCAEAVEAFDDSPMSADQRRHLLEAAAFRSRRAQSQAEQIDRLGKLLPLPQIHLGLEQRAGLDHGAIERLAERYLNEVVALSDLAALDDRTQGA